MEDISYKFPNSEILIKNNEVNKVNSEIEKKKIEEFLIYGDILFSKVGECKIKRVQTPYISDKEIEDIMNEMSYRE